MTIHISLYVATYGHSPLCVSDALCERLSGSRRGSRLLAGLVGFLAALALGRRKCLDRKIGSATDATEALARAVDRRVGSDERLDCRCHFRIRLAWRNVQACSNVADKLGHGHALALPSVEYGVDCGSDDIVFLFLFGAGGDEKGLEGVQSSLNVDETG